MNQRQSPFLSTPQTHLPIHPSTRTAFPPIQMLIKKSHFPQFQGSIRSRVQRHFARNYLLFGLCVNKNPAKSKTTVYPVRNNPPNGPVTRQSAKSRILSAGLTSGAFLERPGGQGEPLSKKLAFVAEFAANTKPADNPLCDLCVLGGKSKFFLYLQPQIEYNTPLFAIKQT
jgi:hypothetical protein